MFVFYATSSHPPHFFECYLTSWKIVPHELSIFLVWSSSIFPKLQIFLGMGHVLQTFYPFPGPAKEREVDSRSTGSWQQPFEGHHWGGQHCQPHQRRQLPQALSKSYTSGTLHHIWIWLHVLYFDSLPRFVGQIFKRDNCTTQILRYKTAFLPAPRIKENTICHAMQG